MRSRGAARGAVPLLAVALLVGCVAGPVEQRRPAPSAAPASPPVTAPQEAAPAASVGTSAAAPLAPAPSPSETASLPPAEPGADVGRLQGMTPDALRGFLGSPDFRRRDGQAEIWQYAHEDCILHVILYPGAGGLTVQHVDGRGRTRAALQWVNTRNCYARVIDLRKVAPAG